MAEFDDIVLREKERSFYISRIPKKTKEELIKFAQEEFADDYGACISAVWNKFKEMINYQDNFDIKLNYIIQLLENSKPEIEKKEEKPDNEIKMLSGRKVTKEVKNG
jgi:3-oxoacyl-ACP reductase-like protein